MKNPVLLAGIGVVIVGGSVVLAMTVFRGDKPAELESMTQTTTNTVVTNTSVASEVVWDNSGATGWQAIFGTPPVCPEPFTIQSPVDTTLATSILYPGQSRPDYKPHGAFRFDTIKDNTVNVTMPMAGKVVRGSRYLVGGELQYTFDIIHPCGMMVRLGHMLELSPKFAALATNFPPAQEGDSRTTRVEPAVDVVVGELVATKVGLTAGQNTFVDLGVYDLRQKNEASKNSSYAASHDLELAQHALCWFNMLPSADAARVLALPAGDPKAGKTSDYCSVL
jgi:hypothetical protein